MGNEWVVARLQWSPNRGRGTLALLAVLLIWIVPNGCASDPTGAQEQLPESLFGTWSWMRATGGIAGVTLTPESTGYTRVLRFTPPNRVELFRNGEPERDTTFEIITLVEDGVAGSSFGLRFDQPLMDFATQRIDFTEEGDLVLTDPCCDGFSYEWRRVI
ncbi:MAG: hypothetical protein O7I93_05815 [Gemmatimonadetes bacterium]|nr:hypothetical protein [Gemmatimonadota bacterium]